jgi:hypothetical protein
VPALTEILPGEAHNRPMGSSRAVNRGRTVLRISPSPIQVNKENEQRFRTAVRPAIRRPDGSEPGFAERSELKQNDGRHRPRID